MTKNSCPKCKKSKKVLEILVSKPLIETFEWILKNFWIRLLYYVKDCADLGGFYSPWWTEIMKWFSSMYIILHIILSLIAFVRTRPHLGVPVVQGQKVSRYRERLPINRPYLFYQGHLGRETGLLSTQFRFRKWRTRIRNQWLPLVE